MEQDRPDESGQSNNKQNNQVHAEDDCAAVFRDELAARALKEALKAQNSESLAPIFKLVPQIHPN